MGSDDEQSLSDCDGSVATVNTVLDSVPVDVTRAAKLRCKLCFSLATELSPLAVSTDAHPRHLEWRQYAKIKIQGRVVAKAPRSKLCNWCWKTFFALGWEDEFGNISEYSKTISTTNKDRHPKFMSARKTVIKSILKTGKTRLDSTEKKDVSDAVTTLDTVSSDTSRVEKPKMQFVASASWQEDLDGKFDPTKETTYKVEGNIVKGIWKKLGREGVWDVSTFEDTTMEKRTRESDDAGPLGKERIEHKHGRMRSLVDNEAKKRNEVAVDAPPAASVHALLKMIGSAGVGNVAASGDGEGDKSSSSSSSSDSSDHSADEAGGGGTKERLESMFGNHKSTAGGTGASTAGFAHVETVRAKPPKAGPPSSKSGGSTKSGSATGRQLAAAKPSMSGFAPVPKAPAHDTVSMDGRANRLRESLEKIGEEAAAEIATLTDFFSDNKKCVWDEPTSREKTKKAATDIKKQAGTIMGKQKIAAARYDKAAASGQAAATSAKEMIDANIERLTNIQAFLGLLLMPQPPLDELTDAMAAMTSRGVRFTTSLCKHAYWLKARSLMLFGRYKEMCSMATIAFGEDEEGFRRRTPLNEADLQALLDCDMPRSEVISYASIVLQQCMSDCINDFTEAQVGLPLSDYPKKKEALAMLEHIAGHCTVDGFAGVDALPSIKKWIILLDLEHANPDSLLELVGEYEAGAKDDLPPTDILGLLLYTTKIGARLLNCAVAWAQTEEETLFVSRHIARMDKLIGQVLQDKPKMVEMDG